MAAEFEANELISLKKLVTVTILILLQLNLVNM